MSRGSSRIMKFGHEIEPIYYALNALVLNRLNVWHFSYQNAQFFKITS